MSSNNKNKKNYFKKEFYVVIIIAIAIILFLMVVVREGRPLKGEEVQLRQPGGSYDDKCSLTRNVSDELFVYVNSGTVLIKDGTIAISGHFTAQGGVNVGTATGASTGDIKLSGSLRPSSKLYMATGQYIYGSTYALFGYGGTGTDYFGSGSGNYHKFYGKSPYPLWLTLDSDSADFTQHITCTGKTITSLNTKLEQNASPPPAASSATNGYFWYWENPAGEGYGELLFCVEIYGLAGYEWVVLATGVDL